MEDWDLKVKKVIHFFTVVFIISLIVTIICLLMLKYSVEGENNMPFELTQLVVVSTAEGIDKEGENIWNFDVVQNNDIYIYIGKNKNYKEKAIIKRITFNNFQIDKQEKGNIVIYRPSENEEKIYEYLEQYEVDEITYTGSEMANSKNLELANQGGILIFRITNSDLGEYSSNDEEVKHDGTLLSKMGLTYEDIKCKITFDITIELTDGTEFSGTITIDLPSGDITKTGTSNYEKKDFTDVIFKRN